MDTMQLNDNMERSEIKVAERFWNKDTHIVVYPVIVPNAENYKINLKTAFKTKNGFSWKQIFTGEEISRPMLTWEDVDFYYKEELKALASIITPLVYDNIREANEAWRKQNQNAEYIIKGMDEMIQTEEPDFMDKLLCREKLKIELLDINEWDEKHPRGSIKHWILIWKAWRYSYEIFKKEYESNNLVKL